MASEYNREYFTDKYAKSYLYEKYLEDYKTGYYAGHFVNNEFLINYILKKYCDVLPINNVELITNNIRIGELELICDNHCASFDANYCSRFTTVENKTVAMKIKYETGTIDKYIDACDSAKYCVLSYFIENIDFKNYLYDYADEIHSSKNSFLSKINEVITGLGAYLYYHQGDPDIIRKVSLAFMCNYKEAIDMLKINGFTLDNKEYNDEYFIYLLSLYKQLVKKAKGIEKVIK